MQMAAAVAVDGEELSPDGEEPSPDRRRTTRSDDACAQSKTVLQDQAGSGYEVPPPSAGPWKRPGGCPLSEGAPRRLSVDAPKELCLVRHSGASWQQK